MTTDCPWCDGPATVDAALTVVACDDCGIRVDLADDDPTRLDLAA